ncbi:amino acid permease [Candidatus Clostridium stratigraminis]|uniref:Amino acid permease n=1 Tax=Candidatus Clostridium stratigraminis TaxID=3381661 RepID=A0ABW8TA04_9CLOT
MEEKPTMLQDESITLKRELGLATATALVIGNTIGSGILMAPQGLAAASNPTTTIIAWIITAIGSILLALSFAKLGSAMPETGGPIVYIREAFGEFASFLGTWTYWIGIWVGDAAIITAAISYLSCFFPIINANRLLAFLISSAILWIFTFINVRGVKGAGAVSMITTICKILPLIIFAAIAVMHFNSSNFTTASSNNNIGLSTLPAAVGITLWSFLGFESATIPAGEIKNPKRNVKLSTIYGTVITAVIYITISVLAIGAMPQYKLAVSNAPLSEIINTLTSSSWGSTLIALGAVISIIGTISGWILLSGRCAYAAAKDKIFPKIFVKIHPKNKTPYAALIISSIGTNIILITTYVNTLNSAFNFIILLSTLSILPVYTFTAAAEIMLLRKDPTKFNIFTFVKSSIVALLAFAYSIYAIYGTGATNVMYGFILILIGIPFYVYMKLQNNTKEKSI